MKGLDTNIVLSWLLGGPDAHLPASGPFWLSNIVLAETVWVLTTVYELPRGRISALLDTLDAAGDVRFDDAITFKNALADFKAGRADFSDYLLMRMGERAGCTTTFTLDEKAARHPGFTLLKA